MVRQPDPEDDEIVFSALNDHLGALTSQADRSSTDCIKGEEVTFRFPLLEKEIELVAPEDFVDFDKIYRRAVAKPSAAHRIQISYPDSTVHLDSSNFSAPHSKLDIRSWNLIFPSYHVFLVVKLRHSLSLN